jgi:hypothetical protein
MALDNRAGSLPFLAGADDPITRDECRSRALEYFLAAEEAGDEEKREALLDGGRKWLRLAADIKGQGRR